MMLRTTPWLYLHPRATVRNNAAQTMALWVSSMFGDVATGGEVLFAWAKRAASDGTNVHQRVDHIESMLIDFQTDSVLRKPVLGRQTRFDLVAAVSYTRGVLAYDGVDFFIAPTMDTAIHFVEEHTTRDGNEPRVKWRGVDRYYEAGAGIVARLRMHDGGGTFCFGRLNHDGSFSRLTRAIPAPDIATAEESCATLKVKLGEPCFRQYARRLAKDLWVSDELEKTMPMRPVIDSLGYLLGQRVEYKYGSILPALGGFRSQRRRASRRVR